MRHLVVAMVGLLRLVAPAAADDLHVPSEFATIQAAINAAEGGDAVVVAPGTYQEHVNLAGKAVTVQGTGGMAATFIDGGGAGTVVTCESGEGPDTIIEGFTIRSGSLGVRLHGSSPTIGSCRIMNHSGSGGMLCDAGSDPVVQSCLFDGNSGADGAAILSQGGSAPTIMGCAFAGNTASGHGGAMHSDDGSPHVMGSVFSNNAAARGGAISGTGTTSTIESCTFSGNTADLGGAIYVLNGAPAIIGCSISANTAEDGGGGVYNEGSAAVIRECTFDANVAPIGAGLYNRSSSPIVRRCTFTGNRAIAGLGIGGGMFNIVSSPFIVDCRFRRNVADWGGAVQNLANSNPTIVDCVFSANTGSQHGGAIDSTSGSEPTVANCTFHRNVSAAGGALGGTHPVVVNCILWRNTTTQIAGNATVRHSLVEGGWPGEGNVDLDPRLVDPAGPDGIAGTSDDDLHLFPGSPCIDAGDNEGVPPDVADLDGDGDVAEPLPRDLDGQERFMDGGAGPPPIVDMGALEFTLQPGWRVWIGATGGVFSDPANWNPEPPAEADTAIFALAASYAVDFTAPAATSRLVVADGDVAFTLGGATYTVTAGGDSTAVGEFEGVPAALTVSDGTLWSSTIRAGGRSGSSGRITLGAGAALVAPGGFEVRRDSVLAGTGVVQADVTNIGTVDPGSDVPGTLFIDGAYTQSGVDQSGLPASGVLAVDIGDGSGCTAVDQLEITGSASLAGGLLVRVDEGCIPMPGDPLLTVLSAGALEGRFDVVSMTGLPGDVVMMVGYHDGAGPERAGVTLEFVPLDSLAIEFGDPGTEEAVVPGAPTAAVLGDFDGDGTPDLAITVTGETPTAPGSVLVLEYQVDGERVGRFFQTQAITVRASPSSLAVGPLDADASLDIAVTNRGDDTVSLLLNNGDGSFPPSTWFPIGNPDAPDQPSAIGAANFDGTVQGVPGETDLAIVNAASGTLLVLLNNGNASFSTLPPLFTGTVPSSVDPTCIDNPKDAFADLVVGNAGSGTIGVYPNLGGATFAPPITIPVGSGPVDVEIRDLDNDDLPDIVSANAAGQSLSVIRNLGGFAFAPSVNLPIGSGRRPGSLTALDMDLDGDSDLAVAARDLASGQSVLLRVRNDLQGRQLAFNGPTQEDADPTIVLVLSGNVDGDADDELITVNSEVAGLGPGDGPVATPPTTSVLENHVVDVRGDLNGDDVVDLSDLLLLLGGWGPCGPSCPADFDGDGRVDFADLLILLAHWG